MTWANNARASGAVSAAAAMLPISRRAVASGRSSSSGGVDAVTLTPRACGFTGDHPFGHHQLGQPAAQLTALAGAGSRQRGHLGRAAQDGLAGVDLAHVDRAFRRRWPAHAHRTVTVTAGVYSSRPAQPIRTSAHHCPGASHGGGAMSKPTSTVDPARNTAPHARRPGPLPGAPRADQVCLEREVGAGVAADGDGQPGGVPWAMTMSAGFGDHPHQFAGRLGADGHDADVLDRLPPGLGHVAAELELGTHRIVAGFGVGRHGEFDVGLAVMAGGHFIAKSFGWGSRQPSRAGSAAAPSRSGSRRCSRWPR